MLVSTWWILLLLRLRRVARALHILRVRIHYTKAPHCDGIECCIHYYESTSVGLCCYALYVNEVLLHLPSIERVLRPSRQPQSWHSLAT